MKETTTKEHRKSKSTGQTNNRILFMRTNRLTVTIQQTGNKMKKKTRYNISSKINASNSEVQQNSSKQQKQLSDPINPENPKG